MSKGARAAILFAALSAARDIAGQILFATWHMSPYLAAWVGCLVTAVAALFWTKSVRVAIVAMRTSPSAFGLVTALNLATIAAFATAFLAIQNVSPAVSSVVDYGVTPIITIAFAIAFQGEELNRGSVIGSFISICGIMALVIFALGRGTHQTTTLIGVSFAVVSALLLAGNNVLNKRLLNLGLPRMGILALRMPGAVVLGFPILFAAGSFRISAVHALILIVWCLVGITLPLYLLVSALSQETLGSIAVYFFLIPVFTYWGTIIVYNTGFGIGGAASALIVVLGAWISEGRPLPPMARRKEQAA
jgi:drug/metabolite transporter (DMT)-like permease